MKVECFEKLPAEAMDIRKTVFVDEQGFQNEFDNLDDVALHFLAFDENGYTVATCRLYFDGERDSFILGRLAVIREYRGRHIGAYLINAAEEHVKAAGGKQIQLHAQCRIKDFYARFGFVPFGQEDDDEGHPHVWMKKEL